MSTEYEIYNLNNGIELAGGNQDLALELFNMLINQLPEHQSAIRSYLLTGDIESLKKHTHKLHGSSQCCGTPALRNAAQALESSINTNNLELLESNVADVLTAIKNLLAFDTQTIQ